MANESRTLYKIIKKKQTWFFGHIIRRDTLKNNVMTGNMTGKRVKGRP